MISHAFSAHCHGNFSKCVGRTFDLKSAYKQSGLRPVDPDVLRLLVRSAEDGELKLLGLNALPFGSIGSVAAFLRISYALWHIGIVQGKLFWTAFFDDFSTMSADCLAANTQWTVESLFTLLGISFATDGRKAEPFSICFRMLGLQVGVASSHSLQVHIGHTPDRRTELLSYISDILKAGWIDKKVCDRLRGRMVFFEGYAFGRVANTYLRTICNACKDAPGRVSLSERLRFCLSWLSDRIDLAEPLCIRPATSQTWIVFTDGACEPEDRSGSIGGVLYDPFGKADSFFGESIQTDLMLCLLSFSENPIYELELAPLLIALELWGEKMRGSQVVFYLDNEGARHSFIRLFAEHSFADSIIQSFLKLEQLFQLHVRFGRVPTSSNIADDPGPGEGMVLQCLNTSSSGCPLQDCRRRSRMATGGHLQQTLLSLAVTLALRIGLHRCSRACHIKRRWLCKRIRPGCYRRIRSTSISDGPRINKPQSVTPEHVKKSCAGPKSSGPCTKRRMLLYLVLVSHLVPSATAVAAGAGARVAVSTGITAGAVHHDHKQCHRGGKNIGKAIERKHGSGISWTAKRASMVAHTIGGDGTQVSI